MGRGNTPCPPGLQLGLAYIHLTAGERAQLQAAGVTQEPLQQFAAWRRSLLLVVTPPTLLTAILAAVNFVKAGFEGFTGLGILLLVLDTLLLFILPAAAIFASLSWTRLKRARRTLYLAWAASFLAPFLIALCPVEWLFRLDDLTHEAAGRRMLGFFLSLVAGLAYFVLLLPPVLSLIPGLLRTCIRIKGLLPGSTLAGWFLLAGAPFYLLLWLIVFVALNQFAGNALLILGVLCWLGAPLLYLARRDLFVCPAHTVRDRLSIGNVQFLVYAAASLGVVLLVLYLLTKRVFGLHLFGLDEGRSLLWLWRQGVTLEDALPRADSVFWLLDTKLLRLVMDYVSRSLFTTAVFADLLLRMTLFAWQSQKSASQTQEALAHDLQMERILSESG